MQAFPVIIGVGSCVVFAVLSLKLFRRSSTSPAEPTVGMDFIEGACGEWSTEWFEDYSSFRYLPMRRLLSAEEEAYWLRSTAGSQQSVSAFRAERRRLFREYLRLMAADFRCLSQGLRSAIVHASEDQSEEISRLIRLEWSVRRLLWQAELRLMFHWLGVRPVDATQLINGLQGLEFSLREMRLDAGAV